MCLASLATSGSESSGGEGSIRRGLPSVELGLGQGIMSSSSLSQSRPGYLVALDIACLAAAVLVCAYCRFRAEGMALEYMADQSSHVSEMVILPETRIAWARPGH